MALTDKLRRFVDEELSGPDATQAAIGPQQSEIGAKGGAGMERSMAGRNIAETQHEGKVGTIGG